MRAQGTHRLLGAVAIALLAILLVRNAWVSDDAFITLRTVDNFLHGYGLRWNVAERVQSYTHPLWMLGLLLARALTGEPYYGTLVLGGLTTLLAVAILWFGVARTTLGAVAATLPLLWSKSFVDFSTSGLENPLTHLLLALLALSLLREGDRPVDLFRTALITALAMLNRLDLIVLFAPALAMHIWHSPRTREHLGAVLAGFVPLALWEIFSFVYYGSLVPNTAYAKLGAGIPHFELLSQGMRYLGHTWTYDRLTLIVIACGLIPLFQLKSWRASALVVGSVSYLGYVVWIGGDFMAGRFLTPSFFAATLAFSMLSPSRWLAGAGITLATLSGLMNAHAPLYSGVQYDKIPASNGIVDERGYYHRGAGLLASKRPISHAFAREGRRARRQGPHTVVRAAVGYFGYYAGPQVHIVDPLGLDDPLIARMPARYDPSWRVGHYRRVIPPGYDPGNDIPPTDPELAALYQRLRGITRGPLLSPSRWFDALRLQLIGPQIDPWIWRFPNMRVRSEGEAIGLPFGARGVVVHARPPRALQPVIKGPAGQEIRILYGRSRAITHAFDIQTTGQPQPLPPSPGTADLLFLFPGNKGQKITIQDLQLGPG